MNKITTIEKCKYMLPCGICDRTGEQCSQYTQNIKQLLFEDNNYPSYATEAHSILDENKGIVTIRNEK